MFSKASCCELLEAGREGLVMEVEGCILILHRYRTAQPQIGSGKEMLHAWVQSDRTPTRR